MRSVMALLVMVVLGWLSACKGSAQDEYATGNPHFHVELLFEHEGCRVYRFYDYSSARYYAHCVGGNSVTEWNEPRSTGKDYTKNELMIPACSSPLLDGRR